MDWLTVGILISKIGIEATDYIIRKQAAANAPVTLEEWEPLRSMAAQTPKSQLSDAITRLWISPDDPEVKALMDMIPK